MYDRVFCSLNPFIAGGHIDKLVMRDMRGDPVMVEGLCGSLLLNTNLTQTSTVGGYGITSVDPRTGEQTYTPLRTSATWLNVAYGKTWRPALFFGYLKNLGASTEVSDVLGTGTNLDQLLNATAELTYNRGNWKLGAEYSLCNAWYGDEFSAKAKALSSHTVMNHRVVMTAIYQF